MKQKTFVSTARLALFTAVLVLLAGCNPLTKPKNTATVIFDDLTVSCRLQDSRSPGSGEQIFSGTKVADNSVLVFEAMPSKDKVVESWKVNDTTRTTTAKYICYFNLKAFQLKNGAEFKVSFTEKDAEKIMVKFDPAKIDCWEKDSGILQESGKEWSETAHLVFKAKERTDVQLLSWTVNNRGLNNPVNQKLSFSLDNYRQLFLKEGDKKCLTVGVKDKPVEKITVTFDEKKMLCFEMVQDKNGQFQATDAPSATGLKWSEGTQLQFKAKLEKGKKVDEWFINGIKQEFQGNIFTHEIESSQLKDSSGEKTVEITYTEKDAAEKKYVVIFDGTKVQAYKKYVNHNTGNEYKMYFVSGQKHPAKMKIFFERNDKDVITSTEVTSWSINGTKQDFVESASGTFEYTVNERDADKDGKITISYTAGIKKPVPQETVRVKFDAATILSSDVKPDTDHEMKQVKFVAVLKDNEKVHYWLVNNKKYNKSNSSSYDSHFTENDGMMTFSYHLNTEEAVIEKIDGKEVPVLEVKVVLLPKVKIILGEKVKAKQGDTEVSNNTLIAEDTELTLKAELAENQMVTFYRNGEKIDYYSHGSMPESVSYMVKFDDAVVGETAEERVIKITCKIESTADTGIAVTFDKDKMVSVINRWTSEAVETGKKHSEWTEIVFTPKLAEGKKVANWYVNGKKILGGWSPVDGRFTYKVRKDDLFGNETINVKFTEK